MRMEFVKLRFVEFVKIVKLKKMIINNYWDALSVEKLIIVM